VNSLKLKLEENQEKLRRTEAKVESVDLLEKSNKDLQGEINHLSSQLD